MLRKLWLEVMGWKDWQFELFVHIQNWVSKSQCCEISNNLSGKGRKFDRQTVRWQRGEPKLFCVFLSEVLKIEMMIKHDFLWVVLSVWLLLSPLVSPIRNHKHCLNYEIGDITRIYYIFQQWSENSWFPWIE